MFRKSISLIITTTFICSLITPIPKAHAQNLLGLPEPGTMVSLSPAYQPALIKGLTVHKDNPFLFDFIVDTGNSRLAGAALKQEGDRLIKYFFASLTIPDKDLWVNLSPYEKDRMVPQALGQTAMGRDLLAQDYMLKQLTASLIYPEKALGRNFWDKVYTRAREQFGTTNIPVDTFNKVWIVAEKASVYEHNQTAFVVSGHLKVMLEEDYLALKKNSVVSMGGHDKNNAHSLSSQVIKQIILPAIENEVNKGQNFAQLRQIFYSQILATWFKRNLRQALLSQVYADKSTVNGNNLQDPSVKELIYQRYLQAYKKGVFNYIKQDSIESIVPRKYFSGGYENRLVITNAPKNEAQKAVNDMAQAVVFPTLLDTTDKAMTAKVITQGQYSAELDSEMDQDGQRTVTLKHVGKVIFQYTGYIEDIRFLNKWMLAATFYSITDPGQKEIEFINIFDPSEDWHYLENPDAAMKVRGVVQANIYENLMRIQRGIQKAGEDQDVKIERFLTAAHEENIKPVIVGLLKILMDPNHPNPVELEPVIDQIMHGTYPEYVDLGQNRLALRKLLKQRGFYLSGVGPWLDQLGLAKEQEKVFRNEGHLSREEIAALNQRNVFFALKFGVLIGQIESTLAVNPTVTKITEEQFEEGKEAVSRFLSDNGTLFSDELGKLEAVKDSGELEDFLINLYGEASFGLEDKQLINDKLGKLVRFLKDLRYLRNMVNFMSLVTEENSKYKRMILNENSQLYVEQFGNSGFTQTRDAVSGGGIERSLSYRRQINRQFVEAEKAWVTKMEDLNQAMLVENIKAEIGKLQLAAPADAFNTLKQIISEMRMTQIVQNSKGTIAILMGNYYPQEKESDRYKIAQALAAAIKKTKEYSSIEFMIGTTENSRYVPIGLVLGEGVSGDPIRILELLRQKLEAEVKAKQLDAAMKVESLAQWENDFRQLLLTMSAEKLNITYDEAENFYQALASIGPYSPDPVRELSAGDALAQWLRDNVKGIQDQDILILEARMGRFFTGIKSESFDKKIDDLKIEKLSQDEVMKAFSVYWTVAMGQADNSAMLSIAKVVLFERLAQYKPSQMILTRYGGRIAQESVRIRQAIATATSIKDLRDAVEKSWLMEHIIALRELQNMLPISDAAMVMADSQLGPGDKVLVQGGSNGPSTGHLITHTPDEVTILGTGNTTITLHGKLTVKGITEEKDQAAIARDGGIDLSALNKGMSVSKDANGGVVITVDPAMIARVRQEGIQRATPVIIGMKYLVSVDQLLGL